MKRCHKCGREKALEAFHPGITELGRLRFWCKACNAVQDGREGARTAICQALNKWELVRPIRCEECKTPCKPDAHHWSYLRKHWMDIRWLCRKCHGHEHSSAQCPISA